MNKDEIPPKRPFTLSLTNIGGGLILAFVSFILMVIILWFAPHEIIALHFDKVVFSVVGFAATMLGGMFLESSGRIRYPTSTEVRTKAPVILGSLIFVIAAQLWWGQAQRHDKLIKDLAETCKVAQSGGWSSEIANAKRRAVMLANEINELLLSTKRIDGESPCTDESTR